MSYLTPADLKTHIYLEYLAEITREDNSITVEAIEAGVAEAQGYLGRYDLVALFGTSSTAPTVTDRNLRNKVKDLVMWPLCRLCNTGMNQELIKEVYNDAVKWFIRISEGRESPAGWPYAPAPVTPTPDGDTIFWTSNPKRRNGY